MKNVYFIGLIAIVYELIHMAYKSDSDFVKSSEQETFTVFISKKWIEVLLALLYLSWIITGMIYCSEVRQLFISILALKIISPFIISSMPDINKQRVGGQLTNLVTTILISFIEYHNYLMK